MKEEIKLDESTIDLTKPEVAEEVTTVEAESTVIEMPTIKSLSDMSFEELKTICNDKKIIIAKKDNSKKALIKLIEKANADVISLDNRPVSPVITNNVDETIPAHFINLPKEKKGASEILKSYKGRFYKEIANGYGMYTDNGQAFKISDLR